MKVTLKPHLGATLEIMNFLPRQETQVFGKKWIISLYSLKKGQIPQSVKN